MKLFATDYDGTLRTKEKIAEEDIEAIKEWRKQGYIFAIVTGRSMESIIEQQKLNNFEFDYIVGNNGGVIYDQNLKLLKEECFKFDAALEIIKFIETIDCASYVINDGFHRCKCTINSKQTDYKYANVVSAISKEEIMNNKKIAQLVISLEDNEYALKVTKEINERFKEYATAYTNVNCIDIAPVGVSKYEGVNYIAKLTKICEDEVYTIGDSYNDLSMIKAYKGDCVATSHEAIIKESNKVYSSVGKAIYDKLKKSIKN
ncbi:MAG: HAD family hydrolase [Erysipelotrichaceae bacterium]